MKPDDALLGRAPSVERKRPAPIVCTSTASGRLDDATIAIIAPPPALSGSPALAAFVQLARGRPPEGDVVGFRVELDDHLRGARAPRDRLQRSLECLPTATGPERRPPFMKLAR